MSRNTLFQILYLYLDTFLNALSIFLLGSSENFGSLYFNLKHMFLYRDPVKNIVSILSMSGSMPKFMTRMFMSKFMHKMICGLCPDLVIEQKALDHINKGLQEGDDQVFAIVSFALHILCYLRGKEETEIKPHTIKYENVVNNPKQELEKIVCFLEREKDTIDYESCLEAMKKDSQGKSEVLSKEKLASTKKKNPITQDLVDKIDRYFLEYGLPKTSEFDELFQ